MEASSSFDLAVRSRAPDAIPTTHLRSFQYRSALALAEAIIPGSSSIPAADEETVARTEEVVRGFSPSAAKAWRVAQATLSAAAIAQTLRPFHALSRAGQDRLLRSWEANRVLRGPLAVITTLYKLVHFDQRPIYEGMGGRFNVVNALETPRWLNQIHPGAACADGEEIECEVAVVGTGAGGAVVGRELADRGFAVVFIEEGEHYRRDAFDGSSIRAHQRFYRAAFSFGNAVMPVFIGRLVGGSTAINTGTCFRTPPWVLERWCDEIGTDEFSPEAMTGYFDRVEEVLQVAPAEPRTIGPIREIMARGCDALGWSHFPIQRNAPGCDGSGFCDFGCRTDARRGTNLSYLPPALEKGAVLFSGLRADRVVVEGGRAVGIDAIAKNGRRVRVRAPTVVLAGGAIPTPMLLLKQGIANRSGQVGRNLSLHPSSGLVAQFDEEIRGHAHIPQGYGCDQFLKDGILLTGAQPDLNVAGAMLPFSGSQFMEAMAHVDQLASMGILISDATRNGRVWRGVNGFPAISYRVTRADVDRMHQGMIRAAEMYLAAGAKRLFPHTQRMSVLEGAEGLEKFRNTSLSAGDIVWGSYHPLGTCRMGTDPKTSVVGLDHQTHDVPGLFVVDASAVQGPLGVNPQITIMAVATRAAEKIAERTPS